MSSSNDVDYKLTHLMNDMVAIQLQANQIQSAVQQMTNIQVARRGYLKKLLVFRTQQKLLEQPNDYINMICTLYSPSIMAQPPYMDSDTTPLWQIADAVTTEPNNTDRLAMIDIFRYAYNCDPSSFFT